MHNNGTFAGRPLQQNVAKIRMKLGHSTGSSEVLSTKSFFELNISYNQYNSTDKNTHNSTQMLTAIKMKTRQDLKDYQAD
jgi:hypothetical protein